MFWNSHLDSTSIEVITNNEVERHSTSDRVPAGRGSPSSGNGRSDSGVRADSRYSFPIYFADALFISRGGLTLKYCAQSGEMLS
ncbi:hypothetical protein EVAR_40779_1 [Eumeta japonica]|uniref:Uncharacterized protein n=1 Tax=Eumeta variegata TaxID=151549 RepID=A0A4C1X466_EUMVA|nr:hypothetical protein EVAR_40779_1 [Eumeta japonica]